MIDHVQEIGMEDSGKALKVGILGCSDIALRKFIPALRHVRGITLRAIASRDTGKAALIAAGLQAEMTSYDGLLAHPEIELVYLSLPNHLHEEFAIRALQSGKHVICEKPLGLSAASVRRMLSCARERGLLLFENIQYLHHPQHALVKNIVEAGEIGRLRSLRSVFCFPFPGAGNFRLDPASGGGAFHDLARYAVSTAWYFLQGECSRFSGYALDQEGLNVAVHGTALTSAQEVFSFSLAFGQPYESYYELIGEQGKIRVDRAYTTPADHTAVVQVSSAGKDASFTVPPADHFQLMIEDVCNMITSRADFYHIHACAATFADLAEQMEKGCYHEGCYHEEFRK